MNTKQLYFSLFVGGVLLSACTQHDEAFEAGDEHIIHVGGVSTGDMLSTSASTRAASNSVAAESLDWLKLGLAQTGMDLTYFTTNQGPKKAQLTLELDSDNKPATSEGGVTKYHLTAYDDDGKLTGVAAKWLGNGAHTFQGVYIPEVLKTQGTHSYDDLAHYTAIPPSTKISATVGRITIPVQHRLARVQAYVLIDMTNAKGKKPKLKGYAGDSTNVENTKLRFCDVDVLDYVDNGKPVWKTATKAVPRFIGELGSIVENDCVAFETFRTYKKKETGELFYPTDGEWKTAHDLYVTKGQGEASGYVCTDYGKVPSYDLVVRPTYTETTTGANVMYDEATTLDGGENKIHFEVTLDNDLEYEKEFTFDLDANKETVVFLRITPEKIDYSSAGSRLWKSVSYPNKYYGVDSENHNLSNSGSSWQRAYTNDSLNADVADGDKYQDNQYVSDENFVELLKQSCEGGNHHGHYFVLAKDIEIKLDDFPADFVFTGHLDAQGYTIKLIPAQDERNWLFTGIKDGWQAEIVNAVIAGGKLFKDDAHISGFVNNCKDANGKVTDHTPELPKYK